MHVPQDEKERWIDLLTAADERSEVLMQQMAKMQGDEQHLVSLLSRKCKALERQRDLAHDRIARLQAQDQQNAGAPTGHVKEHQVAARLPVMSNHLALPSVPEHDEPVCEGQAVGGGVAGPGEAFVSDSSDHVLGSERLCGVQLEQRAGFVGDVCGGVPLIESPENQHMRGRMCFGGGPEAGQQRGEAVRDSRDLGAEVESHKEQTVCETGCFTFEEGCHGVSSWSMVAEVQKQSLHGVEQVSCVHGGGSAADQEGIGGEPHAAQKSDGHVDDEIQLVVTVSFCMDSVLA